MRTKLGAVVLVVVLVLSIVLAAGVLADDGTAVPNGMDSILKQVRWLFSCLISVVSNPGDPYALLTLVYACGNALRTLEQ
jgi:hypothetical protein